MDAGLKYCKSDDYDHDDVHKARNSNPHYSTLGTRTDSLLIGLSDHITFYRELTLTIV